MANRALQGKYISEADITGDAGVAFIHGVANDMKMLWRQHGNPEAGIDGHIEVRDPETGRVRNFYVMLQSKAGKSYFERETDNEFQFTCAPRDLEYWMDGNIPVILVVSRNRDEGYWVSIKDYFRDPVRLASRKIIFNKVRSKFDANAAQRLIDVAVSSTAGIHVPPIPKRETLYTNFVPIESFPNSVYIGTSLVKDEKEAHSAAPGLAPDLHFGVWESTFMSFGRPDSQHHKDLVDVGAIEEHPTCDIAGSDDPDQRRGFVHLLNMSLQVTLQDQGVGYDPDEKFYWFEAEGGVVPREFPYAGLRKDTDRKVVQRYTYAEARRPFSYVRHSAAYLRFERYDHEWGLLINPTYQFTVDGVKPYEGRSRALKKIKLMEKNRAVLGQVIMWARLLRPTTHLFSKSPGLIQFGDLKPLTLDRGIDDENWRENDDSGFADATDQFGGMFDVED